MFVRIVFNIFTINNQLVIQVPTLTVEISYIKLEYTAIIVDVRLDF